ncbi:MAG: imelysin family protein [Salibacteraceae bacterium]
MNLALFRLPVLLLLTSLSFGSCKKKGCTDPSASNYNDAAEMDDGSCEYEAITNQLKGEFQDFYDDMAFAMYQDAYNEALNLQLTVDAFLDAPSAALLQSCRDQWVLAHIPYSQSEILTGAFGPIESLKHSINGWDFAPAYLDYLSDSLGSGIIYDTNEIPKLTAQKLVDLHQRDHPRYMTLGYHVTEFLLWGEDDRNVVNQASGDRSFQDYVLTESDSLIKTRRREMLRSVVDRLVIDLKEVADAWKSGANNYRKEFAAFSERKSTRLAITGLVYFSQYELGRNRILEAFNAGLPNMEESTFSDNTHRDIYYNVMGMKSLLNGKYGRTDSSYVEGTSLLEIFEEFDEEEAAIIKVLISDIEEGAKAIPDPYDYNLSLELQGGVGPISEFQELLEKLGDRITELATQMDMGIKKDLPQ